MDTDAVAEVATNTGVRILKGYLNGTTRSQAYGILATAAATGLVTGVGSTLYLLKRRYKFEPKFVKVPREH